MVMLLSFTIMIIAPIMLVGGVIMALRQDVKLSGLLLVVIPILVTTVALIARKLAPLFRQMQKRIDRVNTVNTDRKSTRLNSSHVAISYAVFCLKKKKNRNKNAPGTQ